MKEALRCPLCKDELILNTWGNSINYYDCWRRVKKDCEFKMSVRDYEAKYQGEMTKLERIRRKFDAGFYRSNETDTLSDLGYLLRELEKTI